MSNRPPAPIHYTTSGGRNTSELRTEPHESEPLHSYEDASPLSHFDAMEEQLLQQQQQQSGNSGSSRYNPPSGPAPDFHQRIQKTRRPQPQNGDGISFWRTSSTGGSNNNSNNAVTGQPSPSSEPDKPSFNSMSFGTTSGGPAEGGSLLGAALQSHAAAAAGDYEERASSTQSSLDPNHSSFRRWDSVGSSDDGHNPNNSTNGNIPNSANNNSSRDANKKQRDLARQAERKLKRDSVENNEYESGRVVVEMLDPHGGQQNDHPGRELFPNPNDFSFVDMMGGRSGGPYHHNHNSASLERSSSDQSAGSILYGKTPNSGALLGKQTSLIFPTGVEGGNGSGSSGGGPNGSGSSQGSVHGGSVDPNGMVGNNHHHSNAANNMMTMMMNNQHGSGSNMSSNGGGSTSNLTGSNMSKEEAQADQTAKHRKINLLLDQCETVRFPFKKKLILSNLNLHVHDIPLAYLCGTPLGNALHKLSLAGNNLGSIPDRLVTSLPSLKHLDLSQCRLHSLPTVWNLPQLQKLNLSNNLLRDFPEESMLEGLPELHDLDMFGNKVAVITVPHNTALLSKLETLNLGYNDIAYLPDELDQLRSLRYFKVRNNFLTKIPMRICDMDLKSIDVSSNPVSVPPLETCERGICSMKRYYQQVRLEDQSKDKTLEELQRRVQGHHRGGKKHHKEPSKKKGGYGGFMKSLSLAKSPSLSKKQQQAQAAAQQQAQQQPNPPLPSHATPPTPTKSAGSLGHNAPSMRGSSGGSASASSAPPSTTSASVPTKVTATPVTNIPPEALVRPPLATESSDEVVPDTPTALEIQQAYDQLKDEQKHQEITVNDTLKVIFVGMAMVGKTSMIKRLIEGKHAIVPTYDERTVGVDIYAWDPIKDKRFEHIDSRIEFQDKQLHQACGDVDVKFSVWDFAGQHVYHATHELFFSSNALYVLVWDMGATNKSTMKRKSILLRSTSTDYYNYETGVAGDFALTYDSESDHDGDDSSLMGGESGGGVNNGSNFEADEDARRAERALERDIDEKVQFWVDCIQSSAPGAAILPVASFSDYFEASGTGIGDGGGETEAKRRCNMLKERLLRHEQRRVQGIERRLQEYKDQNRADDPAAHRLRNLLHPSSRPKLVFGDEEKGEESVVRVSGTQYYGFDLLTERIVNIATGRYKSQWSYPIFNGHVGTRIPRMRLKVRDEVRKMRDKFKVVEWGYFLNQLRAVGLTAVEDISDALHFLTSIGELSYFGSIMNTNGNNSNLPRDDQGGTDDARRGGKSSQSTVNPKKTKSQKSDDSIDGDDDDDENDMDEDNTMLSIDETSITAPGTDEGSLSTVEDFMASGLSQFVFLNPRWLVAAVACILRHDLDREIKETRRLLESGSRPFSAADGTFHDASLNCPVITADDALMLWQAKKITKKAAERAQAYSNNMTVTPFEFLQLLLIRFGVFVPIDLSIEKALLGGKEYAKLVDNIEETTPAPAPHPIEEISVEPSTEELALKAKFFFLPSLLGPGEPNEAWTFKNTESWKTTLCHSVLFPDGVPPGLMERLTSTVLSAVYAASTRQLGEGHTNSKATFEGRLTVREVLCWRTAFFLKLGTEVPGEDGSQKESVVEIFAHLAERDSHLCVGSDYMPVGTRRLIVSGRGQVGDGGRKIWKGGYLLVCKCVTRVMENYGGLEFETHGFCPECLAKKSVSEASWWEFTAIRSAVKNSEGTLRCHHHGHVVDTRFVAGPVDNLTKKPGPLPAPVTDPGVPVQEMLGAVVLVGLWDGKSRKVVRAGSGVIVDRRRGLIVTAGHTLMNVWGNSQYPFGENYYGLRQGKVVIGVIPDATDESGSKRNKGMAVFRYFAKIVAKDQSFERGECHLDACVLRITTKMENDVSGNGEGCGDQPEILMLNNEHAFKAEKLQALKISDKCELEEQVRVLGFNQGGEGLLGPGESLNRFVDFARGYVCKKFVSSSGSEPGGAAAPNNNRDVFKPREEIAIICPTIGGHSGGPCVNQQGEVIGILSRADPADSQRCYLSPTSEWKPLIKLAKKSDGATGLLG